MHTIVGAGGAVSNSLTKELLRLNIPVRLVSRKSVAGFPSAEWRKADLKDLNSLLPAAEGSEVIYITAGLKYDIKIWRVEWPLIARNIIELGKRTKARIIFFDNVYMYGNVEGPMKEDTPYNPVSRKGEVRAAIATTMMEESLKGNINLTIARAADFYGAESMNSFFDSMVLAKLAKGSKPAWLGNPATLHSFTYVPDAGKCLHILGSKPESSRQIWHVPTAGAITGHEFIRIATEVFQRPSKFSTVNKLMLDAVGLFNPMIRETSEMYYQYKNNYVFDSSKFEKHFAVQPTSYRQGMEEFSKILLKK